MGLFSGKTTITVDSVAYNMSGDVADRQNFLKQSMIFLTASEQSIGEKLPRMYLSSLGVKLKRAYKHAAMSEQGLPTASIDLWQYQDFEDAVQSMLDVEYGPLAYKVLDAGIVKDNASVLIERYLNDKYGWDAITGLMSSPPEGFTSNANVVWILENDPPNYHSRTRRGMDLPSSAMFRGYRVQFRHDKDTVAPDLEVTVSLSAVEDYEQPALKVMVSKWTKQTRSDKTVTEPFKTGDVASNNETSTTKVAGSRTTVTTTTITVTTDGTTTNTRTKIVDATTSEAVVQTYQLGTGAYPQLDSIWESRDHIEQSYFPSIRFRVDNEDVMHEKYEGTEHYEATKKICSLMGIDALEIRNTVNDNKSIKDIDYAFLQAGANMNTESQAEMDYLFRFWDMCHDRQTATETDLTAWEALGYENRPKPLTNTLTIKDPQYGNGAYDITIQWDWVKKTVVDGKISPTAKLHQLDMIRGTTVQYDFTSSTTRYMMDSTVVTIRKQINATQYEQIEISGAIHKNDVYQGKTVETLAADARSNPKDNEGFIIPLHMGIFNSMPLTRRTQLAQECLYMVFNCYVKTKQKWYQTSAFKIILAIILIIVIVVTWGAASTAAVGAWGAVATSVAATVGISVALAAMLLSALTGLLVSYLLGKWKAGFVSVFGEKWAGVVMAIISIVVSAYTGGITTSEGWLQTAVQIIDIATQLFTAYAKGVMITRQHDYDAFMDQAEEDKKLLEKLSSEFFGDNDLVSIDYLLRLQKTLREDSPTTFLSRTLMTGSDVVDITLGQISEMVTMNTTPRLQGIF